MTSVTPGYLVHDLDTRASSRVLARPGGNSSMGSIIGDPNAKFDDGRGSATRSNPPRQQQQQQQNNYGAQQQQHNNNYASQQHYQPNFQPQFNNAAQNKANNQNSNIFDYSNLHQNIPRAQGNQSNAASHSANNNMSYSRQVAQSQNRSDIFSGDGYEAKPNRAPQHNPNSRPNNVFPSSTGRQQPIQSHSQQQYQHPQQQQQQQNQGQVHTSVKVRAPPGGRSSITFG